MAPFITGLLGGLAIAAPVGPIGMLCIRRSVAHGRSIGFMSGLGAATADAIYGSVAAFGLTAISEFLLAHQPPIQLVGGIILVVIGVSTFRARPVAVSDDSQRQSTLAAAYGSTLLLTLMNPMTIISFLAVFAGVGSTGAVAGSPSGTLLVLGVFVGSVAWWAVVSMAGGWLGRRLQEGGLRIVNWIAGGTIAGLGLWQLARFARHLWMA